MVESRQWHGGILFGFGSIATISEIARLGQSVLPPVIVRPATK
jgi:hypothetical protein